MFEYAGNPRPTIIRCIIPYNTKPAAHQNIQLIAAEQEEPEPRVNIVTRSGASTNGTS